MGEETRERLLAVARDLMHARSYADVSVGELCRAAGVHKGSFYHFFPSKADLGRAVRTAREVMGAVPGCPIGPLAAEQAAGGEAAALHAAGVLDASCHRLDRSVTTRGHPRRRKHR